MNKAESIYIDGLRIIAAILVYCYHFQVVIPNFIPRFNHGHEAVIVFFVLSGYVISYVTDTRECTPRNYLLSRFSRLYSVAIPALLLTIFCDIIGMQVDPAVYFPYPGDWPVVRFVSALFFSSELWFLSIQPFSDGPYWSICYEFWYYIIFAAFIFLNGRKRLFAVLTICVLIGPKILLLFPIWLLGVAHYYWGWGKHMHPLIGLALFLTSFFMFYLVDYFDVYSAVKWLMDTVFSKDILIILEYSNNFLMDYITGVIIFINLIGFRALSKVIVFPKIADNIIKFAASFTFSVYLYHYPLIKMFTALLNSFQPGVIANFAILFLSLSIIGLLGKVTEHRKKWLHAYLDRLLASLGRVLSKNQQGRQKI
ncbi:MAG: acyltransferase [Methylococcales bacterium]|nr:acyltransferase [Methylococcales bacterium]